MTNPLTADTNVVLKIKLGENGTRRIPFAQLWDATQNTVSYDRLQRLALDLSHASSSSSSSSSSNSTVSITYVDEDGDTITVSTDDELTDAIGQFCTKVPPVLRATATLTPQRDTEPLSTLRSALVDVRSKLHAVDNNHHNHHPSSSSTTTTDRRDHISHLLDSILLVLSQALESIGQQVERVKQEASKEYQDANQEPVECATASAATVRRVPLPRRGNRCGEARRRALERQKIAAMMRQEQQQQQQQQHSRLAKSAAKKGQRLQATQRVQQQERVQGAYKQQQEALKQQREAVHVQGSSTFIHGRHTCDGCLVTPIVGIRYHATNVPDYDLCQKCFPNYKGTELVFAPEELDRDRHLQTRWQRRQERQERVARQATLDELARRNPRTSNASTPTKGNQNKAILKSMDSALKEAIRRSLEEALPSKQKGEIAQASAPVETKRDTRNETEEEEEEIVVAPTVTVEENMEPEQPVVVAVSTVKTMADPVEPEPVAVETKDMASNTTSTDAESKTSSDKSQAAGDVSVKMVSAVEDLKETISELLKKNSMEEKKDEPNEMAVGDDLKLALKEDLISEISCASSKKSEQSEQMDANHSRDFSFTEGAEDDVALTIGKALDKCADAIDALQSSHSIASSFEEVATESVVSVKSEAEESSSAAVQSKNSGGQTILPSVNDTGDIVSMSSEDEWQCVENVDDEFAKAAHLLGSAMFQSDIASPSASGELGGSFLSGMTSVPTINSEISQVLLARYEDELRQLHQLGFLDDYINVDALEQLEAANIGVGSTDAIAIERVVDHILKNRSA